MHTTSTRISASWCALGLLALGPWGCSSEGNGINPDGSGGAGAPPGISGSAAMAGGPATAGAPAGGMPGAGGSSTSMAGASAGAGGGSAVGGKGGTASGGTSSGGSGGAAGGSSGGSAGGSSGGMTSGACMKGQTKGSDVAVIGESFIAATHGITQQIEKQAKAAGSLPQNERYIDNSVSGTTLANDQIPSQYVKAAQNGKIKYVLMDGGGNDCLLNNNGDAALTAATALFKTMAEKGTEKVVYFFYPDPIGANFNSLKTCLDALRPKMKALCDGLTAPKCYWLDLRPTWNGHNGYTSDGIHPTAAGSIASGDAIWETMKTHCVAQ